MSETNRKGLPFWLELFLIFISFWSGVAAVLLIGTPDNELTDVRNDKSGLGFYCEEPNYYWVNNPQEIFQFRHRVKIGECEFIGEVTPETEEKKVKEHIKDQLEEDN